MPANQGMCDECIEEMDRDFDAIDACDDRLHFLEKENKRLREDKYLTIYAYLGKGDRAGEIENAQIGEIFGLPYEVVKDLECSDIDSVICDEEFEAPDDCVAVVFKVHNIKWDEGQRTPPIMQWEIEPHWEYDISILEYITINEKEALEDE